MMLDADVVAVSASSVYRVLSAAGLLRRWNRRPSKKGQGFHQPTGPHRHWHIDISHVNIAGTFYFLCSILDGYSRFIVHWEIRPKMEEIDVEAILQRAREKFPGETPRIISDNGPQFIAKDFKQYIRICGMTHVRTSPYYPQSNGKLERYHRTIKSECIRPGTPLSLEDARRMVSQFVTNYNEVRLHSALGYIAPQDKLLGREQDIFDRRDRKLEEARQERARRRRVFRDAMATSRDTGAIVEVSRAEDRAMVGTNSSADPEAKMERTDRGCQAGRGPSPSPALSRLAPKRKIPGGLGDWSPNQKNTAFSPS